MAALPPGQGMAQPFPNPSHINPRPLEEVFKTLPRGNFSVNPYAIPFQNLPSDLRGQRAAPSEIPNSDDLEVFFAGWIRTYLQNLSQTGLVQNLQEDFEHYYWYLKLAITNIIYASPNLCCPDAECRLQISPKVGLPSHAVGQHSSIPGRPRCANGQYYPIGSELVMSSLIELGASLQQHAARWIADPRRGRGNWLGTDSALERAYASHVLEESRRGEIITASAGERVPQDP